MKVLDWLLAKGFPALTLPLGAHASLKFTGNNFDLSVGNNFKTDKTKWPRTEQFDGVKEWKHSDYKDITYQHVFKFYDKLVNLTEN